MTLKETGGDALSPERSSLSTDSRGRLCFYLPNLYPVAARRGIELAGGIEVQHWAVARALARRGFDVTVATFDYGQDPSERHEGVRLLRTYSTDAGAPVIISATTLPTIGPCWNP